MDYCTSYLDKLSYPRTTYLDLHDTKVINEYKPSVIVEESKSVPLIPTAKFETFREVHKGLFLNSKGVFPKR